MDRISDSAAIHDEKAVLGILLIEDSRLLREMLVDVLSSLNNVAVVAEAAGQEEGVRLMENHRPDLAIIDLELSEGSGIGVLTALSGAPEKYGNPRTVVFTNHGSNVLRNRCEALGVDGFFDKSYQLNELIDYIQEQRDSLSR